MMQSQEFQQKFVPLVLKKDDQVPIPMVKGTKMNIGVKEALEYDFDYMMNLGSDDIITKKLLDIYKPFMQDGRSMFGSTKVAFIDSIGKEIKHFDYGILIGAGRMIKKSVLKECVYKDGEVDMYDKIQCGLEYLVERSQYFLIRFNMVVFYQLYYV